ncbi:uncharacterized protein LOC129595794 [Paramacrobiotus metropolitanus]|uniref:uncharacterized protein LOC129595794 n=1 Tax=Paramacrobiotus metropolitanus TaxID=2943436 RepID=UPI0024461758|nr:uncharacterized protein LOC129595794 [Paramacrobiotus metropolitanus]
MSDDVGRTIRVDVLGDDNLFRNGRVVDISDNGLFVDFFCPNRRREFTPFNRIFQSKKTLKDKDLATAFAYAKPNMTIPVDALVLETPSGPWIWIPAEIINMARGIRQTACGVAVVQWIGDIPRMDLVPLERLRWRVAGKWWATIGRKDPAQHSASNKWHNGGYRLSEMVTRPKLIKPGTFEKHSAAFPENCRDVDVDKLLQHLNGPACRYLEIGGQPVSFAAVMDGRVWYVRRPSKKWYYFPRDQAAVSMYEDLLTRRVGKITAMLVEESTPSVEIDDVHVLPSAVLLEVFAHLDTRTQTGLRSVCFAWNGILESPVLAACIVVTVDFSCEENAYQRKRSPKDYFLMSPVFKCLRKSTQHIVVDTRGWSNTGDFLALTDGIQFTCQKTGTRLRTIHLAGVHLELRLGQAANYPEKCKLHRYGADSTDCLLSSPSRLVDFVTACGGLLCDSIHLVNSTIVLEYAMKQPYVEEPDKMELSVRRLDCRLTLNDALNRALWDALEGCVKGRLEETQ